MRPEHGSAELHVGWVCGQSAVLRSRARSPVCLLTPQARGASVWAFTSSLGGGLVAGDEVTLSVAIDEGARCFLGTQSSTKIYRNPRQRPCSQSLQGSVASKALLVLAPDPVQCFADASYEQRQKFELAHDANLILLDWLSAGRLARGERWAFRSYSSRNEIARDAKSVFIDALHLDGAASENKFQTGRFNCLATLVMTGPLLTEFAQESMNRVMEIEVRAGTSLVCAASPIRGGAVLRFAGDGVAEVGAAIHSHLGIVRALLADDPWLRKW
jgi:urease accessory protein